MYNWVPKGVSYWNCWTCISISVIYCLGLSNVLCCGSYRFGNMIERLVGTGSSFLVPPLQTLPEQPIGKVYNPFAVSLADGHLATVQSKEKL